MDRILANADAHLAVISRAFDASQLHLTAEAHKIFRRYTTKYDLTPDEAMELLQNPISQSEYYLLLAKINAMPQSPERLRLEALASRGAYAYRITQKEALQANIAIETAKIARVVEDQTTGQLRFTAAEAYQSRMFDIQQQLGHMFAVPDIDGLQAVLDTSWSGANYSDRAWANAENFAEKLNQKILEGFTGAKSWREMAQDISQEFGAARYKAERLVRTESSYLANQRDLQAYKDANVIRYMYVTSLDARTCPVCAPLDRQIYEVAKAVVGDNYPILHPNCRCTTASVRNHQTAYSGRRRGRGTDGKEWVLFPKSMTHAEWVAWQRDGGPMDDIDGWLSDYRKR